jgi:hypothetical protein
MDATRSEVGRRAAGLQWASDARFVHFSDWPPVALLVSVRSTFALNTAMHDSEPAHKPPVQCERLARDRGG